MKIRLKLVMLNSIISLMTICLFILVFVAGYMCISLKNVEKVSLQLLVKTNTLGLNVKTFLYFNRTENSENVIDYLDSEIVQSYNDADFVLSSLLKSPGMRFMNKSLRLKIVSIREIWQGNCASMYRIRLLASTLIPAELRSAMKGLSIDEISEYLIQTNQQEYSRNILELVEIKKKAQALSVSSDVYTKLIYEIARQIEKYVNELIFNLAIGTFVLCSAGVSIAFWAHWMFAETIVVRIKKIEKGIEALSTGDFSSYIDITTNDEFGLLAKKYSIIQNILRFNIDQIVELMKYINMNFIDSDSVDELLTAIATSASNLIIADRTSILVLEEPDNRIYMPYDSFTPTEGLLNNFRPEEHADDKGAVLIEPLCVPVESNTTYYCVAVPVKMSTEKKAWLFFEKKNMKFSDLDIIQLNAFSEFAVLSIENQKKIKGIKQKERLEREMDITRTIQFSLLPNDITSEKFEISAKMIPADEVGGDYYDFIKTDKTEWFVIGDVSGHGVASGLVAMMVQTSIHLVLSLYPCISPAELLNIINVVLYHNFSRLSEMKYITLMLLCHTGNGNFIYSGQHLPVLVYREKTRTIELMMNKGCWVGIFEDTVDMNRVAGFSLEQGDVMLLYTDGIIEAQREMNYHGEMFGLERLCALFKSMGSDTADRVIEHILHELEQWTVFDDVCLFVVKRRVLNQ